MPVIAEVGAATRKNMRREVNEISDVTQEVENDLLIDHASHHEQAAHHAPGREHYSHYRGDLEGAPNARSRFVGAHRHVPARETEDIYSDTATLSRVDEDVLIFHQFRAAAQQASAEARIAATPLMMNEVVVEAARRRRRARAPHRAFRLNATQMLIGGLLLAQLIMVLWLQSQSLALRNQDGVLRRDIAQIRDEIAQKKSEISQLDSEAHLNELAAQLRWSKAPQSSFDKITDTSRLAPPQADAVAQRPLNGNRLAQSD